MRHEWEAKDGEDILKFAVEDDGMFYRYPDDQRWRQTGGDPRAYRTEILRLAEENQRLRGLLGRSSAHLRDLLVVDPSATKRSLVADIEAELEHNSTAPPSGA